VAAGEKTQEAQSRGGGWRKVIMEGR